MMEIYLQTISAVYIVCSLAAFIWPRNMLLWAARLIMFGVFSHRAYYVGLASVYHWYDTILWQEVAITCMTIWYWTLVFYAMIWYHGPMYMIDLNGEMFKFLYTELYKYYHRGPPPTSLYQLNRNEEYFWDCDICDLPFDPSTYGNEIILTCGHRFHQDCLSRTERYQFRKGIYHRLGGMECVTCETIYGWMDKWDYIDPELGEYRYDSLLGDLPDEIIDAYLRRYLPIHNVN